MHSCASAVVYNALVSMPTMDLNLHYCESQEASTGTWSVMSAAEQSIQALACCPSFHYLSLCKEEINDALSAAVSLGPVPDSLDAGRLINGKQAAPDLLQAGSLHTIGGL